MLDSCSACASSGSSARDVRDRLYAAGERGSDRAGGVSQLRDRFLDAVRLLVERVLRLLEIVEGGVGPVGDEPRCLSPLGRVGCPGVVDPLDHRVGRLHGALEPDTYEASPSLRRLRLRFLATGGRELARGPELLDDVLHRTAPDADGAARGLRPLAGRHGLAAVLARADRHRDEEHQHDPCGDEDPGGEPAHAASLFRL